MIKIIEIQENEKIRELATFALLQNLWLIFYENVKISGKEEAQTSRWGCTEKSTVNDAIYT